MTDGGSPGPEPFGPGLEGSEKILRNLHLADSFDRVERIARQYLSIDPHHTASLYYLIVALINLGRIDEAEIQLERLSSLEPDTLRFQIAAVSWCHSKKAWKRMRRHLAEGLRLDPNESLFHYYAAVADLNQAKLKSAKRNIARARELEPDSAEIADLFIRIHGLDKTTAEESLAQIDAFREALELDPHNASLHHGIGEVYLKSLDDPVEAERHFREALRIEPTEGIYREDLFFAVARRSLLYRLVSIPSRTMRGLGNIARGIRLQPWRSCLLLGFLLLSMKFVAVTAVWLLLATLLFWPGGKVYEWLLVSEIKGGRDVSDRRLRIWYRIQRWPRPIRFAVFLCLNLAVWAAIFALLKIPLGHGLAVVAAMALVHFLFVWLERGLRRYKARKARRKAARSNRSD